MPSEKTRCPQNYRNNLKQALATLTTDKQHAQGINQPIASSMSPFPVTENKRTWTQRSV